MRRFGTLVAVLAACSIVVILAIGFVVIQASAAWRQYTHPGENRERAPESMPMLRALEREHVSFLRTQDWCQAYTDDSGTHANTLESNCTFQFNWNGQGGVVRLFDRASKKRYQELKHLADDLPYSVHYVEIHYAETASGVKGSGPGPLAGATLALEAGLSRQSLVYEPGYDLEALRANNSPDPSVFTPIDANWYHLLEDWM
jgi:hypothetical protein